jgi:uncharacterized phage-associated protein
MFPYARTRRYDEIIADRLLLMYLIDQANKKARLYGITKLMKLVFLAEYLMTKKNVKGFNYNFFRWHLGAFTPELYDDLDKLESNGIVAEQLEIDLTEQGRRILNECSEIFEKNRPIIEFIHEVIEKYAGKTTNEIIKEIYEIPIEYPLFKGEPKKIKEIPEGWDLISKLDESLAEMRLDLEESWVETLEICFSKKTQESLEEAMKSARAERACEYKPIS